ncbi:hypothetical protein KCMC57_up16070 [Kitasatospora sp. CMC57]|uniref:PRC-barrel domain-containing protein n=1 Tax=Kitasatospora sp. CMC57 TaxID=3231513 RepID=A0AB33JVB3_9ACTN
MPTADLPSTDLPTGDLRTADLIGAELIDHQGKSLGRVTDLGLDEARLPNGAPALRLVGLVASSGRLARLLCLDHRPVDRPRLLGRLARRMTARARWIPWCDIAMITPGTVRHAGVVHLKAGARPEPLVPRGRTVG